MSDHSYFAKLIWQVADLLRGPYRPPQYERVMLPMTVLRRFDCVLASSKANVLVEHARRKGGRVKGEALDRQLNNAASQRFHNLCLPFIHPRARNLISLRLWPGKNRRLLFWRQG